MGRQMACFGPFLEIGPAPCGEMKALVAPGSLTEGSHSDGPSLGREMSQVAEMGRQMACFGPCREIGPVCPRATGGPRTQQVVPLPRTSAAGIVVILSARQMRANPSGHGNFNARFEV